MFWVFEILQTEFGGNDAEIKFEHFRFFGD